MQRMTLVLACTFALAVAATPFTSSAPTMPYSWDFIVIHHNPSTHPTEPGYRLVYAPSGWSCLVNGVTTVTPPVTPPSLQITGPNPVVECTVPAGSPHVCLRTEADAGMPAASATTTVTATSSCVGGPSAQATVTGPVDYDTVFGPPGTGFASGAPAPFSCSITDNSAAGDWWYVNCMMFFLL